MSPYWISFRLCDDAAYDDRLSSLHEHVMNLVAEDWWSETTSFYAFKSRYSTGQIVNHLRQSINEATDLVIVGNFHLKTCRVIGKIEDHDLFEIVPEAKKA